MAWNVSGAVGSLGANFPWERSPARTSATVDAYVENDMQPPIDRAKTCRRFDCGRDRPWVVVMISGRFGSACALHVWGLIPDDADCVIWATPGRPNPRAV